MEWRPGKQSRIPVRFGSLFPMGIDAPPIPDDQNNWLRHTAQIRRKYLAGNQGFFGGSQMPQAEKCHNATNKRGAGRDAASSDRTDEEPRSISPVRCKQHATGGEPVIQSKLPFPPFLHRANATHRTTRSMAPATDLLSFIGFFHLRHPWHSSGFAGFECRLFPTDIIRPATALFNFIVLFAHAYTCTRHCSEKPITLPPVLTSRRRAGLTPRETERDEVRDRSRGCAPSKP